MAHEDDSGRDSTGHVVIEGSRWHFPAPGRPTECGVPGCERVMGQQRRASFEDLEAADETPVETSQDLPKTAA